MPRIVSILIAWALCTVSVSAQEKLSLKLSARPHAFILGEPVTITALLVNEGGAPAIVTRSLKPQYQAITYEITRRPGQANAERFTFTPWAIKDLADPVVSLAPHTRLEETIDLFFDGQEWVFPEPGSYLVEAFYHRRVRSNPLLLSVVAPRNEKEALAARLVIETPEAGRFLLLGGGDHLTKGIAALSQLVKEAGDTPQALHANLVLGLNAVQPFPNFAKGTMRPAQGEEARKYFNSVAINKYSADFLSVDGAAKLIIGQAQSARLLNRPDEADKLIRSMPDLLRKQYPDLDVQQFQKLRLPSIQQQIIQK